MRVAIIAPNCGWDLAKGGGTYIALNMAKALSEKESEVHLLALESLNKNALEKVHNIDLSGNVKLHSVYTIKNNLISIPFPLGYFYLSKFLKRKLFEIKPDIVIFHDDALRSTLDDVKAIGAKNMLYMHFSYKVRSKNPIFFSKVHSGGTSKILLFLKYSKRNFADIDEFDCIVANSSVTKRLTQQWYPVDIHILHPPINVQLMNQSDVIKKHQNINPLILSHLSQQDKTFLLELLQNSVNLLLKSKIALARWKFLITRCDKKSRLRLKGENVIKFDFIANPLYQKILLKSHIITHYRWFETFGIAVLEAMANGCIPIVYASSLNSAWIDIIEEGKHGYGFLTDRDFLDIIENLVNNEEIRIKMAKKAILRAKSFSSEIFKQKFMKLVYK